MRGYGAVRQTTDPDNADTYGGMMSTRHIMTALSSQTGKAACIDVSPTIIDNDDEMPEPSPEAQALCGSCDIKEICLAAGLSLPSYLDYGIWGGKTKEQRDIMKGKRVYVARTIPVCPGCRSSVIIEQGNRSTCLVCEITWHR